MKIWIVASSLENINLFKILNQLDHQYQIYRDWANWPYGDKKLQTNLPHISKGIQHLLENWTKKIILPPIYELYWLENEEKGYQNILPIFTDYLLNHCLKYSLVGKLGFVGNLDSTSNIENLFKTIQNKYTLTSNQQNISKFHQPFATWTKTTSLWKDFLKLFSNRSRMVRKTIKTDLRYFKDANVDTLIPLSYGYLAYDKIFKDHLNFKKIRYHDKNKLSKVIKSIFSNFENSQYNINIFANGNTHFLTENKKRKWLLQKGKQTNLNVQKINWQQK